MALDSLDELDQYKAGEWLPGYPKNIRRFYAPVDKSHDVLAALVNSAQHSIYGAMYGFADGSLSEAILRKLEDQDVHVVIALDKTQAAGAGAKVLLEKWVDYIGSAVSIGSSERGAIMHLKMLVIDGIDVVTGSTNWSVGGETKQDNEATVIRDAVLAAEARDRIAAIHSFQLAKMR